MTENKHGGVRPGAGRPKSEPTKMVRVPVGFYDELKSLIHAYRNESPYVVFDGPEAVMVFKYLKQHSVCWKDCKVKSETALPGEIHEFVGDELLACMARKAHIPVYTPKEDQLDWVDEGIIKP